MRIRDRQTWQVQRSGPLQPREQTTRGHGSRRKVPRLHPKCRWSRPTQKQSRNSIETSSCRQETRGDKNRVTTHEAASDSLSPRPPSPPPSIHRAIRSHPHSILHPFLLPHLLAWQRAGTRYDDARLLDDHELSNCPSGRFRARGLRDTSISLLSRIISLQDTDRHVSRASPDKYPPRFFPAFTLPRMCLRMYLRRHRHLRRRTSFGSASIMQSYVHRLPPNDAEKSPLTTHYFWRGFNYDTRAALL